jgi:8-oxo-dGTP diphosphatase
VKLATLIYVRQDGKTLMVHRNKKPGDMHAGKWNGLGGKLEAGETPEACAVREVLEESGLTIRHPEWRGLLTFPDFAQGEDWYAFVYVARDFSGSLIDSPEGRLAWVPDATIASLPLWPGDRIFLPWLDQPLTFSASFRYVAGALMAWSATLYGAGGVVLGNLEGVGAELPAQPPPPLDAEVEFAAECTEAEALPLFGAQAAAMPTTLTAPTPPTDAYVYSAREDGTCWLCGAQVDKRNCKIICRTCGFTRDCSDP